jgi:hypothetical protein
VKILFLGAALLVLSAGCNLVLGLEEAETIAVGTGPPCNAADDCDDANACTTEECLSGNCSYTKLHDVDAPGTMQIIGDCRRIRCQNGDELALADDTDIPDDGKECTTDSCSDGMPVNEEIALHTPCPDTAGRFCNDSGDCVECTKNEHCTTPGETCGGSGTQWECGCTPDVLCGHQTCGNKQDNGCGVPLDCNNNAMDGNETGEDCGGLAAPQGSNDYCPNRCQAGEGCLVNSDCASSSCNMAMMMCN